MKSILKCIITGIVLSLSFAACKKGYIDPISKVDPGPDELAPIVEIISPSSDIQIPPTTDVTNFDFKFKVTDDIELSKVDISLNGTLLKSYASTDLIDYRGISGTYTYADLGLGAHTFEVVATDLSGKSTTKSFAFNISNKYIPLLSSEVLYVPFDADFKDLINTVSPVVTGTPAIATGGHNSAAYQGATDAYLTFPIAGLYSSEGISFSFWYKLNASPDRSGIITINDNDNNSDENRSQGLRLFREVAAGSQTMKINVGTGSGESWNDGGAIPGSGAWVHVAVTVSPTESKIYFNGVLQRTATYTTAFDFSTSTTMTIGSGAPSFTYWSHLSDLSLYDEFRVFNKVLTPEDIELLMQ
ncbi:LamG-like jellyroll fold domain-containing protein [Terrimonas sp.]|uniref:LamG-like jellyroll fold domain-containing protein n=1 Tax=Terrimonas sp. TaxID=1914338 RepID=UPI001403D0DA|nr:LamG-like jellyroll fold domain-containing protein [Terrimonas sp.]